jgi:hypothetical protein
MRVHNTDKYPKREGEREHIIIVLQARKGKPLPPKSEIHHFDGDRSNNKNNNLVVCPNTAYHRLIEARTKRYKETGDFNLKKCIMCKQIKSLDNFHKDKQCWDNKNKRCKICISQYRRIND